MPVNTKLTGSEVEYIFTHSEAKAIIYDVRFNEVLSQLSHCFEKFEDQLVVGGDETLATVIADDSILFKQPEIN
ncbi:hypothetical protein [Peribacillus asahii]|uniref:hypothetical protein n=1 Tax=Peribacillus asahii TaxID=228899 RepID=UPI00338E85BA